MKDNNFRVGDYVRFMDYSTAIGEYPTEDYEYFMKNVLQVKSVSEDKITFFGINNIFNLINRWGFCPFEKDIYYTRKMKIKKLLKNEII